MSAAVPQPAHETIPTRTDPTLQQSTFATALNQLVPRAQVMHGSGRTLSRHGRPPARHLRSALRVRPRPARVGGRAGSTSRPSSNGPMSSACSAPQRLTASDRAGLITPLHELMYEIAGAPAGRAVPQTVCRHLGVPEETSPSVNTTTPSTMWLAPMLTGDAGRRADPDVRAEQISWRRTAATRGESARGSPRRVPGGRLRAERTESSSVCVAAAEALAAAQGRRLPSRGRTLAR